MDVRLYKKAKAIADPFAFDEFKKRRIREKIEQERPSRLKVDVNLPPVNKELAAKFMSSEYKIKRKKTKTGDILEDNRFKVI